MEIKTAVIVITDISGYTQFIHQYNKSLLHAEALISELIHAIIQSSKHPLMINKLEGDAVLFVALTNDAEKVAVTKDIVEQSQMFFENFKLKQRELIGSRLCDCDACKNLEKLQLKIIMHIGQVLIKKIQQFEEIAGTDVIVAHRLLKNSIDANEYLLMTQEYYQTCGGWLGKKPERACEHIVDIGKVDIVFYRLQSSITTDIPEKNKIAKMLNLFYLEFYRLMRYLGLKKQKKFSHLPTTLS